MPDDPWDPIGRPRLVLTPTSVPPRQHGRIPQPDPVMSMNYTNRLWYVLRHSLLYMDDAAATRFRRVFTPDNLEIIAATTLAYVGLHAVGVGEVIDIALLGAAAFTLGWDGVRGLKDLIFVIQRVTTAQTESDLKLAAMGLAEAVVQLGVDTAAALMLGKAAIRRRAVREPWPREKAGPQPVEPEKTVSSPPAQAPVAESKRSRYTEADDIVSTEAPKSPHIKPKEVANKTPDQIDRLAKGKGLISRGPNPKLGRGSYIDPVTRKQRILCHTNCSNPHAHVNNPQGRRLDINGNVVPPESPAAHLPIKTQ